MFSFSQLGQDINVIEFYNKKIGGFFVEIGATNAFPFKYLFIGKGF